MPSHSPHALCPSIFRAPRWGAPASSCSCRCWWSAAPRGLAPFNHRSASRIFIRQLGCIPSPMVTQDGDHQFDGGGMQAGLRPLPRPQLQGSSSSLLGRRVGQIGACLRVGRRPASSLRHPREEDILQLCGGGVLQPCGGRRTAAPWPGCSCPSSIRATVVLCAGGCCLRPCRWGGLRQRESGRPQASSAPARLACWLSWLWRHLRRRLLQLGPSMRT
jgi:hypothetical protein